jgi:hypothetical protein
MHLQEEIGEFQTERDEKGTTRYPFILCTGRKGQDSERHEVFGGKESKKQQ